MDDGVKCVKYAFALTIKHFLLTVLLVIIIPIPSYILFKTFPLLSFLYLLTVVLYSTSGIYGYLCHYFNDRFSLGLFVKNANKYYVQNIIIGLLITVYVFLIAVPLGIFLAIILPLDKITERLIWQTLTNIVMVIVTVYMIPFLFVYDAKNGTAVKYGLRYFKFIIKNKRNEFLYLFLLILASLTAGLVYKANFYGGAPAIWIGASIIKNYLALLIFLTAAIQLMFDPRAKEIAGVRERVFSADKIMDIDVSPEVKQAMQKEYKRIYWRLVKKVLLPSFIICLVLFIVIPIYLIKTGQWDRAFKQYMSFFILPVSFINGVLFFVIVHISRQTMLKKYKNGELNNSLT